MTSVFTKWEAGSVLLTDAGWGDSGKGKVASALTPDIGAKIIGGHNAGHTIATDKGEFGLGLVPSTVIFPRTFNVLGQELVVNPFFLVDEIKKLNRGGIKITSRNFMFDVRSHMILPWHEVRDALSEEARGTGAIGSLHLGVGWTYSDRVNRRGLRFIDLFARDWKGRVEKELGVQEAVILEMRREVKRKTGKISKVKTEIGKRDLIKRLTKARTFLAPFAGNTIQVVWGAIEKKKRILFEGSHGAMLEVSHGSWPFTTGVNTALGAVHRSFGGKAVKSVNRIVTVVKAYQTRVGGGPMPTEDFGKLGEFLQTRGGEVGTRSGRKRRCGPLDASLINYGLNVIGAGESDEIALTKLDVLSGLKKIPVCVGYKFKGKVYRTTPRVDTEFLAKVKPVYKHLSGWEADITKVRNFKDLPANARKYVKFVSALLGRKITFIGVGKHKDAKILSF
ncbi:MAG TPA: adenylosuccinate synthetase [Patescibacteria group bacterium]|nr:adenylosuccinate synthetase [Patescibacteria group bacterium]